LVYARKDCTFINDVKAIGVMNAETVKPSTKYVTPNTREDKPKTTIATKVNIFNIRSGQSGFLICNQMINLIPNQIETPAIIIHG